MDGTEIHKGSEGVGSFTKRDEEATILARAEKVEPAGVHHSKHKKVPLIDDNEELLGITDYQKLLMALDKEYKKLSETISKATGEDPDLLFPLAHKEMVIGNIDHPNTWVRMAPTKPDPENGKLNFFRNIHQPGLVDLYTSPPGAPNKEPGTLVSIGLNEVNSNPTEHRRTPSDGRRMRKTMSYGIKTLKKDDVGVWLVGKVTQ